MKATLFALVALALGIAAGIGWTQREFSHEVMPVDVTPVAGSSGSVAAKIGPKVTIVNGERHDFGTMDRNAHGKHAIHRSQRRRCTAGSVDRPAELRRLHQGVHRGQSGLAAGRADRGDDRVGRENERRRIRAIRAAGDERSQQQVGSPGDSRPRDRHRARAIGRTFIFTILSPSEVGHARASISIPSAMPI